MLGGEKGNQRHLPYTPEGEGWLATSLGSQQLVFSLSAPRGEPTMKFSAFLPVYTSKTKQCQNWQPPQP